MEFKIEIPDVKLKTAIESIDVDFKDIHLN
jgi:hypothetical protein